VSFETHPLLLDERLEPHEVEAIRIAWRVRRGLPPRLRVESDTDIEPEEALEILAEIRERQKSIENAVREAMLARHPAFRPLYAGGRRLLFIVAGAVVLLLIGALLLWMSS
jgi:hypothetical protein